MLLCPFALAAAAVQGQVLVNDSFADGDIANTGPLQASWNYSSTSGGIEIAPGALGLVSGSSGRGIHGAFTGATLAVGEMITASFTFTTPATIGTGKTDAFRISLLNSNGTDMSQGYSASSGSPEALLDNPIGYWVDFDVGVGATADLDFRESLTVRSTGRLMATSSGWNGVDELANANYDFTANTEYTGIFTVMRTGADAVKLSTSLLEGATEIAAFMTTNASAGIVSTFDTIAFHVNSATFGSTTANDPDNGLTFSNVTITVAVPEPSALALLVGAFAAMGMVARRRR